MLWTEVVTSPRPNLTLHRTKSVGLNSCKSYGTCNYTDQHTCSITVQQVDTRSHDAVIVYDSKFYESLRICMLWFLVSTLREAPPKKLHPLPFGLQFSLHKWPKPSWQGFRVWTLARTSDPQKEANAPLNLDNLFGLPWHFSLLGLKVKAKVEILSFLEERGSYTECYFPL